MINTSRIPHERAAKFAAQPAVEIVLLRIRHYKPRDRNPMRWNVRVVGDFSRTDAHTAGLAAGASGEAGDIAANKITELTYTVGSEDHETALTIAAHKYFEAIGQMPDGAASLHHVVVADADDRTVRELNAGEFEAWLGEQAK